MVIREARLHVGDCLLVLFEGFHSDFPRVDEDVPVSQFSEHLLDFDHGEELFDVNRSGHVCVEDVEDYFSGRVDSALHGLDSFLDGGTERRFGLQEPQVRELVIFSDFP